MKSQRFKKVVGGKKITLYTLKNKAAMLCQITNYGGRIVSLWTKDKNGIFDDIVLGFDSIDAYLNAHEKYFGAAIGRYANRIANGHFAIAEKQFFLAKNNGNNHLHGGNRGFHAVVWEAKQISDTKLILTYLSKDGEEGYAGNVNVQLVYEITSDNALKISYSATTDKTTPINLTHHSFFNLKGAGNGNIEDHFLQIEANFYLPIDKASIPTGEIASIQHTPFDFKVAKEIGKHISTKNKQLRFGNGYDHTFVLNGKGLRNVAKVIEPRFGRTMQVLTDEIGMQFYSGNFLNGKDIGKNNKPYNCRNAFCLETQRFPNSPNQDNFPSTLLNSGETYQHICIYKFDVETKEDSSFF
ncbi:MAG: aldose epimerase family protein [Chitinophagales bacterium]